MLPSGAGSIAVTAAHFTPGRQLAPIARRLIRLRQIVARRRARLRGAHTKRRQQNRRGPHHFSVTCIVSVISSVGQSSLSSAVGVAVIVKPVEVTDAVKV